MTTKLRIFLKALWFNIGYGVIILLRFLTLLLLLATVTMAVIYLEPRYPIFLSAIAHGIAAGGVFALIVGLGCGLSYKARMVWLDYKRALEYHERFKK